MATREEIREAFEAAKERTALDAQGCQFGEWNGTGISGRFEFICHALETLSSLPGADEAGKIIKDRFKFSIYSWLYNVAKIPSRLLTDDNVQAYKHRWLDSVIKEFSE